MATGWLELLKAARQQKALNVLDREQVWDTFEALAAESEHAEAIGPAVRLGQKLPVSQRYVLAMVITRLLANAEWPLEWQALRPRLMAGLEHLLRESDPRKPDSFPALLNLQAEGELQEVGYWTLVSGRELLRKPCRRVDLRNVAALCNMGNRACFGVYRRALQHLGDRALRGPLIDARMRFVVAFEHYAQAARELNDACGAVLFVDLEARLDVEEVR